MTYFSVKSTVTAWLSKPKNMVKTKPELSLVQLSLIKLRDIGVLNDKELGDVVKIYETKGFEGREHEDYLDYFKVLSELKEIHYFGEDVFNDKMSKLKNYYKLN
jgi:hypothetical protein